MKKKELSGKTNKRIDLIDALRGVSILLMVIYHFHVDMNILGIIGREFLYHPVFNFLQSLFAGLFIFLSGISARFSRNNLKRGILMLAAGMAVTLVTYLFNNTFYVRFGILHFLGSAAILYAAARPLIERIPVPVQPFLFIPAYYLSAQLTGKTVEISYLWMFGFVDRSFTSSDFFPLLPHFFLYLAGTCAGWYVVNHKMPSFVYRFRCRTLAFVGRNTMWIYLAHQPVCMALAYFVLWLHNIGIMK